METKTVTKDDYKKWLLYSFDSGNPEKLFNLYKALDSASSSGPVMCKNAIHQEGVAVYITCEQANDDLLIKESAREEFKKYLIDNYFRTENVQQWYIEKINDVENKKNFAGLAVNDQLHNIKSVSIKPHPKEVFYLKIRIAFCALFYLSIAGAIISAFMLEASVGFMLLLIVPVSLAFILIATFFKGILTGLIRGNAIQLTENQFPEIYSIVKEEAKKLDLSELPLVYIAQGPFNAFVTSFARSKFLLLFSEVVETSLAGDYDVVRFVIAHELCHLKRKHLLKEKILFPSNLIPFLYRAYSRGCEFTCDRIGYLASPKGSIKGILIMTTGKDIYSRFNVDLHIKNASQGADFWTWLSEKFLTHPHLYKRLIAIKKFSEYNQGI